MDTNTLVRLKKIVSNHNNLRTDEVVGYLLNPVRVGQDIILIAQALDPEVGDTRYVQTTPVLRIEGDRYFTRNSVYEITAMGEVDGN